MEPIVLIHGAAGASWRDFAPLIPRLEESRPVEVMRIPGSYEADRIEDDTEVTFAAIGDWIEEQLDALGLEQPDIIGESTGGWITLELARRGRARAVVAICPSGMWTPEEARKVERDLRRAFRLLGRTLPLVTSLTRTRAGRYLVFAPLLGTRGAHLSAEDAAHVLHAIVDSQLGIREQLDVIRGPDGILGRAEGMAEINCPVLILWGENDRILPLEQGRRWADEIAGAELTELIGTGHHPQYDCPDEIAKIALEFFDSVGVPA